MSNYKNTLNLPITKFSMRANLAKREPQILARWNKDNLYQIIRKAKTGKQVFILHDGPPYANGKLHIGHSVNKILKDIIIKSKGLAGFDSPYIPGWDCHGLPIEQKVEKIIGQPSDYISAAEFRKECRKYAKQQIEEQKNDFIRMGILGDWDKSYLTMNFDTEANIIRVLGQVIKNNYLIRGTKPVHWCTTCSSSLAEAEVEYHNKISSSIYVRFSAVNDTVIYNKFGVRYLQLPVFAVIWTTTPWTLPANRAIAVNAISTFQLVKFNNLECLILAKPLVKIVMQYLMATVTVKEWQVIGQCNGSDLELIRFNHPFMNFDVPIILSDYVSLESGTGMVHYAPSHGLDDYIVGKKYKLDTQNIVGPNGCYFPNTYPGLDGVFVFTANDLIIKIMNRKGALLHKTTIQHKYPCCWRHKTPIIFRTTPQWFISMEKNGLREQLLKAIQVVKWVPKVGKSQIESMIKNHPDWCISRQRTWGTPIALFIHKQTEELHPRTLEIIEVVAQSIEKKGIQAWWDLDPIVLLGNDAKDYNKIIDTLDVWFDSGSTHSTVIDIRPEFKGYSANMYLEGSDQYRGWFLSSLILSVIMKGTVPYREVLIHGFVVDKHSRKMSKSIGNIVSPQDIMNNSGADVLRLWIASTNYTSEITISNEILNRSADSYRRIRNTARFILSNINDFDPIIHKIKPCDMMILDRWAVGRAKATQTEIIKHYANYNFHVVIQQLMHFCSIDMGSFYLDIIKDRLYTTKRDSLARRSCQTALFHIIEAFVRWIAPLISFTADEIWQELPGEHAKYVFTEEYYRGLFSLDDKEEIFNDYFWNKILLIRSSVNKILEQARVENIINNSLEASVILYANPEIYEMLNYLDNELRFILLTSQAKVIDIIHAPIQALDSEISGLKIICKKMEGNKCPRCWHYTKDIGIEKKIYKFTELCNRCNINLTGKGEIRKFA